MAWHLKKEVSYGHIISTVTLASLLVAGWIEVQSRIAILEQHPPSPSHAIAEQRLDRLEENMARVFAIDAAMSIRLEDLQDQIIRRLDRQDIKLDRIEDRLNQHDMGNGNGG